MIKIKNITCESDILVLALTDPLMHLRTGVTFNGTKGGGEIKLSDKFQRMEYGGDVALGSAHEFVLSKSCGQSTSLH